MMLYEQQDLLRSLGQVFMIGFRGISVCDEETKRVLDLAKKGLVGGVIFFRHNFIARQQILDLVGAFRKLDLEYPLLLAIDQEGGSKDFGEKGVQRLWSGNGFRDFPTAQTVAETLSATDAYDLYKQMAIDVKAAGLNLVFGPVVDLYHPESQIIGRLKRSYGVDPLVVAAYAKAFIRAFHDCDVLTCLKHFPGHGFARQDSHKGLVDVTRTHRPEELAPFIDFVKDGYQDLIMSAHVMHRAYDETLPATLSPHLQRALLGKDFSGIFVSDDLMMGAIRDHYTETEAAHLALKAGIDLLVFSRNPAASQGVNVFSSTESLGGFLETIQQDLAKTFAKGALDCQRIQNVLDLKARFFGG